MKKLLLIILTLLLIVTNTFTFVSCDTEDHSHETEAPTAVETDDATETDEPAETQNVAQTDGTEDISEVTEEKTEANTEKEETETEEITGIETVTENGSVTEKESETENGSVTSEPISSETKTETEKETETETETEKETGTDKESDTSAESDICAHKWSEWKTVAEATCTEEGLKTRTCSVCKDVEKTAISLVAHEGGEATCTRYAVCSTCGNTYGELAQHDWKDATCIAPKACNNCSATEGEALGHTGGEATCTSLAVCERCANKYGELAPHEWLDATCTAPKSCDNCTATEGEVLGHTGGKATCTSLAVCERCNNKYGELDEHDWVEADCDEPKHCSVCDLTEGEANDHTGGKATCTELAVCTECGKEYGELAQHEWRDATCTEPQGCKNCTATQGEALGHTGGEATCTDLAVCTRCEKPYGTLAQHDWIDATCTEPKHCKNCTATQGEKLGHTGGESTCTSLSICDRCQKEYGSYVPHSYTEKNTDSIYLASPADCNFSTKYFYSCACGRKGDETFNHGEKLGHKYVYTSNADGTHTYVCANDETHTGTESCSGGQATCIDKAICDFCNEEYGEPKGHNWELGAVPMSEDEGSVCTAPTSVQYICPDCGETKTEVIPAPGHKYDVTVTAPGCASKGYTTHTCSVCGDSYTDSETEPTGEHIWDADKTCTSGHICTVCGTTEAPLGHTHTLTKTTDATCTAPATALYTCNGCGDSYEIVTSAALGHSISGVTPTEEEIGNCEYVQHFACSTCSEDVVGETVYHHTYTATITKEANCHTVGTKQFDCSVCGDSYTKDIEIDTSAHVWDDGTASDSTITYNCTVNGCDATRSVVNASDKDEADVSVDDLSSAEIEFNEATLDVSGLTGSDGVLANSNTVTLSAGTLEGDLLDAVKGALSDEEKKQLGDNPIYNFTMSDGDSQITDFGENYVTVTIPYKLAADEDVDSIAVWYMNGTELVSIKATYSNGYITFKTNHFSYYTVTRLTPKQRCALYGHSETYTTVEPTCTSEGYTLVLCIRCAESYKKDVVSATGHSYTSTTTDPTCTEVGSTAYTCSTCGHSYEDKIPAKGHSYDIQKQDASCSAEGFETGKCSCGDTYTIVIPKLAHTLTSNVVAPTCETDGYTLHECSNCDYSYTDSTVSATGHSLYDEWSWADDNKSAKVTLKCKNECGFLHETELEAVEKNTESTCFKAGKTEYSIKNVYNGITYSDSHVVSKDKSEHVFEDSWKHDGHGHWHKCKDCAEHGEISEHEFGDGIITRAATCSSDGEITFACICGETRTEIIPKDSSAHRYVDNVCIDCGDVKPCEHRFDGGEITTSPTCQSEGEKTYTCFLCGEIETETLPSSKHHTYGEGTVTAKPTCTEDGEMTYACIHCGTEKTESVASYKGHSFDSGKIAIEPSCLTTGVKVYSCERCGEIKEETLPSLGGHSFNEVKYTEPSCTEDGETVYVCEGCGARETEIIPSLGGHSFGEGKRTEPTCTESGRIVYVCESCGEKETEIIPSLGGHSYDEGKVTKEPTCVENGSRIFTCSVCQNTKTELISATGKHSYVDGICSVCGHKDGSCDHSVLYERTVDLKEYGACGGILVYMTCDCGEVKTVDIDVINDLASDCDFEILENDYTEDENGNFSAFSKVRCEKCGLTVTADVSETSIGECAFQTRYDIDITIGDKDILTGVISEYISQSHTSCEDKIDLSEYTECGGYLVVNKCKVCGKVSYLYDMYINCDGEEITGEYVDENGISHYTVSLTCNECGLVYKMDSYTVSHGACGYSTFTYFSIFDGDEEIINTVNSDYFEEHNYETTCTLNGKTCDDGYTVTETCTVCGSMNSWTNYGHQTESETTDVYACGGNIEIDRCTICKTVIGITDRYCQSTVYEKFEFVDDDGITHYGFSSTCSDCGTIFTSEDWEETVSECIRIYYSKIEYQAKDGTSLEITVDKTSESHNYSYEYTMNGESCDDGYTVKATCSECGDVIENEMFGHRIVYSEYELSDIGGCGGYISVGKCHCGLSSAFIWEIYSGYTQSVSYYTDENGVEHETVRRVCTCGNECTVIICDKYLIESFDDDCCDMYRCTYTVTVNGDEIVTGIALSELIEDHDYTMSINLHGSSCFDGVEIMYTCTRCGNGYGEGYSHHEYVITESVGFSEYGACADHSFVISKCACGEYVTYSSDILKNDEASCVECGIAINVIKEVKEDKCAKTELEIVEAVIGENKITLYSSEISYVEHKYNVSIDSDSDGNITVVRACSVCGDTRSDTSKTVELVAGDEGYCYDLIFTPENDGVYSLFSIGDSDTAVTLFRQDGDVLTEIMWADDNEYGTNFYISYELEASVTYVYRMRFCSGESGSIQYIMTLGSADCAHASENRESFAVLCATSESCNDGTYVGAVCKECGNVIYASIAYYHVAIPTESIDLSEYGICGGKIYKFTCPCGQESGINWEIYCNSHSESISYKDGNGIYHNGSVFICDDCGMRLYDEYYSAKDGCYSVRYRTVRVELDGETLAQYTEERYRNESHDYSCEYFLLGSSCEDGVIEKEICRDCGLETGYQNTFYYHAGICVFDADLNSIGSCGNHYYYINTCPCGAEESVATNITDLVFDVESGCYFCADCGMYFNMSEVETVSDCKRTVTRSLTVTINGEEHVIYSESVTNDHHEFNFSITEGEDGSFEIVRECVGCSLSISDTSSYISLVNHDGIYYYDLIITPEKNGRYDIFSVAHRDTYVTLYALEGDTLTELAHDDDSAGNANFKLSYTLEAGKTYVYRLRNLQQEIGDGFSYFLIKSDGECAHTCDVEKYVDFKTDTANCDKGYYLCELCAECGAIVEIHQNDYHNSVYFEEYELKKYGACGGYVSASTCPCGFNASLYWSSDCQLEEENTSYTDEDGIVHTVTKQYCTVCGFSYTEDFYTVEDKCYRYNYCVYTVSVNGNTVASVKKTDIYYGEHSYVRSFELKGDDCEDGYTVIYTCQNCGDSYTEEGSGHSHYYTYYDFSAGYAETYTCPCGAYSGVYWSFNCEYSHSNSQYTDENGIIHDVNTFSCESYGTVITEDRYISKEGCYEYCYNVVNITVDDKPVISNYVGIEGYGAYHDFEYSFILHGTSCEDGYTRVSTCNICGESESYEESGHCTYVIASHDLEKLGACGGYVDIISCACGEQKRLNYNLYCSMSGEISEYTDESGIVHSISTETCSECGLIMVTDTYDVVDGCYTYVYQCYTVTLGETVIADSFSFVHAMREEHDLVASYVMDGTTCENGVTVTHTCKDCGYSYSDHCSYHVLIATDKFDLSEYGSCGGTVELLQCPCGEKTDFCWNLDGCSFSAEHSEYTDDNGIDHDVYVYLCPECEAKVTCDSYALKSGCTVTEYRTYSVTVKETVVVSEYSYLYTTYDDHDFEYSFTLEGESCYNGYTVTMTCKDCSYTETSSGSDHRTYPYVYDVSEPGACGGNITLYRCACGSRCSIDPANGLDCDLSYERESYTDDNGVYHYILRYTCSKCSIVIVYDEYTVTEGCKVITYRNYTATFGETEIFNYTYVYTYHYSHSYEYTYALKGASCADGFTVSYTCKNCGDSGSHEETGHYIYSMQQISLSDYNACGGTITINSCPCGQYRDINISTECSLSSTCTNLPDANGIIHSVNTSTCRTCGLEIVYDRYAIRENCTRTEYTYSHVCIYSDFIVEGNVSIDGVFEDHDYGITFELYGESCTDGYKVTYSCNDCEHSYSMEEYDHYTYVTEEYDLMELGACGGSVEICSCACGQTQHANVFLGCACESSVESFTEDGIDYVRYTSTCSECGLIYTETTYNVLDGCYRVYHTEISVRIGENIIVPEFRYSNRSADNHRYEYSFEMNGSSCTDGYTVIALCSVCGDSYESYSHYHSQYEVESYDLEELGACGGYVTIRECPCGEYKQLDHSLSCPYSSVSDSYTDENGIEHITMTYTCPYDECGLELIRDVYTVKEGCYRVTYRTYSMTIGENTIIDAYTYVYTKYEDHDYEYSFTLAGDSCEDGCTVTGVCKDCQYTFSYEISYHEEFLAESYSLKEYGACGGYLYFYSCPCGCSQRFDFDITSCNYDITSNQYYDDDGHLVHNDTYSCDECGMRLSVSYYTVKNTDECRLYYYYTVLANVGTASVLGKEYTTSSVSHDYAVSGKLDTEDTSCTDGVTLTYTCRDCEYTYDMHLASHASFEVERFELDSVCGGYVIVSKCACGYSTSVDISNVLCELDYQYTDAWIEDIVPDGRYSLNPNSVYISNQFGIYTCAVTDPEQCAYKIRYAKYFLYVDGCIAQEYVAYQFGYDEESGTCDKEIIYPTSKRYVCHQFVSEPMDTVLDDGTQVTGFMNHCSCGTFYQNLEYRNESGLLIRSWYTFDTPIEDRAVTVQHEEEITEYVGADNGLLGNYETSYTHMISYSDGNEYFYSVQYEYDFDYTASFGEDSYIRREIRTQNENTYENTYIQEYGYTYYNGYCFFTYHYQKHNIGEDGESWYRYDYSYSFEGVCMRAETYTDSNGERVVGEFAEWHISSTYEHLKDATCTQHGAYAYVCVICGEHINEYSIMPIAHNWIYSSEKGCYYCSYCGLENANGANGDIVMEDLTDEYGNGENYVVGYWDRNNVDFIYYASLILHTPLEDGNDEIVLTGIEFTSLEDVRAIAFSKDAVEAAAVELGYTSDTYDVRFAFVPVGSDSSFDYAITFTDGE